MRQHWGKRNPSKKDFGDFNQFIYYFFLTNNYWGAVGKSRPSKKDFGAKVLLLENSGKSRLSKKEFGEKSFYWGTVGKSRPSKMTALGAKKAV